MKLLACVIGLIALLFGIVGAEEISPDTSCISKISTIIGIGDKITVFLHDQDTLQGRLTLVDQLNYSFKVGSVTQQGVTEAEIAIDRMNYLTYGEKGHIRPGIILGGLVIGGVIGHIFEFNVVDRGAQNTSPVDDPLKRGAFWGAVGGMVVGSFISVATPTERKLSCNSR